VIGGFAGTGKSTVARRLSAELGIPRLGSDDLGWTIKASAGLGTEGANPFWVAYDVLFALCEQFVSAGVSTIVETSMGWQFQWDQIDSIVGRHPAVRLLPFVLRCPLGVSLARIQERHRAAQGRYDAPEAYATEPNHVAIREFLDRLDRPNVTFVDAARPPDEVYQDVRARLADRWPSVRLP
jgi:predicted kinase